ncbi:hypothetical protein FF011L_12340 [Roseimaritima multifibrata]|uniref:Uncharacterized protein n=1 Tax=Roseimaritima multifibrata TaxID=1930274 RepID=A0A517MC85_9BACT|nr:hypothetical protein FF011L_12340 [Roseimaritima multifibrata]
MNEKSGQPFGNRFGGSTKCQLSDDGSVFDPEYPLGSTLSQSLMTWIHRPAMPSLIPAITRHRARAVEKPAPGRGAECSA